MGAPKARTPPPPKRKGGSSPMLTNLLNALSPTKEDKIFTGVLEKRSRDGTWKPKAFYVHGTVLCYYLEDQDDKIETGPHASLNLLSVERVDAKTKDDKKVVRLWIDEKKKVELRQAPVVDGKDEAQSKDGAGGGVLEPDTDEEAEEVGKALRYSVPRGDIALVRGYDDQNLSRAASLPRRCSAPASSCAAPRASPKCGAPSTTATKRRARTRTSNVRPAACSADCTRAASIIVMETTGAH